MYKIAKIFIIIPLGLWASNAFADYKLIVFNNTNQNITINNIENHNTGHRHWITREVPAHTTIANSNGIEVITWRAQQGAGIKDHIVFTGTVGNSSTPVVKFRWNNNNGKINIIPYDNNDSAAPKGGYPYILTSDTRCSYSISDAKGAQPVEDYHLSSNKPCLGTVNNSTQTGFVYEYYNGPYNYLWVVIDYPQS
jgi:hypothetical protein